MTTVAARLRRTAGRAALAVSMLGAALWVAGCAGGGPSGDGTQQQAARFAHPNECATCHPRQYQEWQGAMMAYATISPVFNALEANGNLVSGGAFAADGSQALFCQKCHTPIGVARDEFPPYAEMDGRPSRDFAGEVASRGLSCDFCHQVAHANLAGSLLGDGIANSAVSLSLGSTKFGPFTEPLANSMHDSVPSDYLRSGQFCGGCHDVRTAGTDAVTGEPFRRLENAFTEWQQGPYSTPNNPYGRVVTCQDCHMSAFPYAPPGTYFQDRAADYPGTSERPVVTHYFTGVDIALVDFPGQDDPSLDEHGVPVGQIQRREDLLRAACRLDLEVPPTAQPGTTLPIAISVTNTGAGHNVPTGFSQERQMWIELTVSDSAGGIVYRSGYLVDAPHPETGENEPDGNLDDEDLNSLVGTIDPHTMEAMVEPGPDRDQRPEVNLGLVNYGNEFQRLGPEGTAEVFVPFLANHMDNTHSIPPLETAHASYDVPLPADLSGPLSVSVRLRFRPFPPRFLRMLAQARPDLVSEATVDRNRVVDMASAAAVVDVP